MEEGWVDDPVSVTSREPASDNGWVDDPVPVAAPAVMASPPADQWQDEPAKEERGAIGKAWDQYKKYPDAVYEGVGNAWHKVTGAIDRLNDPTGGLIQGASDTLHLDDAFSLAKKGIKSVWHGLGSAANALDLATGTTAALVVDSVAGSNLYQAAAQKDLEDGKDLTGEFRVSNYLPVSFTGMVQHAVEKPLIDTAKWLQKDGKKTNREIGEVIEGLAPGFAVGTAILASATIDPIANLQFGRLTELGETLEKAGQLSNGTARQIAAGERNLISMRIPGGGIIPGIPDKTMIGTGLGEVGPRIVEKASEAMAKIDMSAPGQWLRNYTTKTGIAGVDEAAANYVIKNRGINYLQEKFPETVTRNALALGVDLEKPEVRKALYAFADSPSTYKMNSVLSKEQATQIFAPMQRQLEETVTAARAAGININEKEFPAAGSGEIRVGEVTKAIPQNGGLKFQKAEQILEEGAKGKNVQYLEEGDYSERYVPRNALPSKRQQLMVESSLKDAEDAEKFIAALNENGSTPKSGTSSFLKSRDFRTRDAMNQMIFDKYGISDYFHDDIVLAYSQKISDIQKAINDKQLVESVLGQFGKNEIENIRVIDNAKRRVESARLQGIPADPDDMRIMRFRSDDMHEFSRAASDRLDRLGILSKSLEGAKNLKVPGPVGDLVEGLISPPSYGSTQMVVLNYMRAMKNATFFNFGFHLRNFWESAARGMSGGVGALDNAKSSAALFLEKGPWADRLEDFTSRTRALGLTTSIEEGIETAIQQKKLDAVIRVNREMLSGGNPLKTTLNAIKEMGTSGNLKGFLSNLRSTAANPLSSDSYIVNNPLYRFSAMAGEKGEAIPKFAYFNKLVDAGYEPDQAIIKMNRRFLNYDLTRTSVRAKTPYVPFLNYMVKNSETVLSILAENPRNALVLGPQGAFQRALENWSGLNPNYTQDFKDQFGVGADEWILLSAMPGSKEVFQEKDYLKKFMFNWFKQDGHAPDGTPLNQLAGGQLWAKLPTNYHALQMTNPMNAQNMLGPIVKSTLALFGVDPLTGNPLPGAGTDSSMSEKAKAIFGELGRPFVPTRSLVAARAIADKIFPQFADQFVNLGLGEGMLTALIGSKATNTILGKKVEDAKKSNLEILTNIKNLGMAGVLTAVDVDTNIRILAKNTANSKYILETLKKTAKGRLPESQIETAQHAYIQNARELRHMADILSSYNAQMSKHGADIGQSAIKYSEGSEDSAAPAAPIEPQEDPIQFEDKRKELIPNIKELLDQGWKDEENE